MSTRAASRPAMIPTNGAGDFCVCVCVGFADGAMVGTDAVGSAVGTWVGVSVRMTVAPPLLPPPDDGTYGFEFLLSRETPNGEKASVATLYYQEE